MCTLFLFVASLLAAKKISLKVAVENDSDMKEATGVIRELVYLKPMIDAGKLADVAFRKDLETKLGFSAFVRVISVSEEGEILLYCPTAQSKSDVIENQKEIEEIVTKILQNIAVNGKANVTIDGMEHILDADDEEG